MGGVRPAQTPAKVATCAAPIAFEYELIRRDEKTSRTMHDLRRSKRAALERQRLWGSSGLLFGDSFVWNRRGGGVGDGSARAFSPTTGGDGDARAEVRVAQFGFEPFVL